MLYDAIENGYVSESTLLQECLEYLSVDDCEDIADTLGVTDYYEDEDEDEDDWDDLDDLDDLDED